VRRRVESCVVWCRFEDVLLSALIDWNEFIRVELRRILARAVRVLNSADDAILVVHRALFAHALYQGGIHVVDLGYYR